MNIAPFSILSLFLLHAIPLQLSLKQLPFKYSKQIGRSLFARNMASTNNLNLPIAFVVDLEIKENRIDDFIPLIEADVYL